MSYGKNICKQLKAIRRNIAEENGIPLDIPECTYQGECSGTCPQCESEVRYLETELARHLSLGKAATVAGIAVTLASPTAAQVVAPNQDSHISHPTPDTSHCYDKPTQGVIPRNKPIPDSVAQPIQHFTFRGQIVDKKSQEPIVFANVVFMKGDKEIRGDITDFDGYFKIPDTPIELIVPTADPSPDGYHLQVSCAGYDTIQIPWDEITTQFTIHLSPNNNKLPIIVIDIDGPAPNKRINDENIAIGEIQVTLPGTPASESGDPNAAPRVRIKKDASDPKE